MTIAHISLNVKSNVPADLRLHLKFNGSLIQSFVLTDEIQHFYHEFDNTSLAHSLEIELANKLPEHTKTNIHNEIIEDVFAEIFDIKLSGIDISHVFYGQSLYFHDYNGATKPVVGQFYRQVGCNGKIKFDFFTPVYLWLYENI